MTQLKQFLLWQLREFTSVFKDLTIGKVTAFAIGGQLGYVVYQLLSDGFVPRDCVVLYTIPITMLLAAFAELCTMQWERFKREQQRILDNLHNHDG